MSGKEKKRNQKNSKLNNEANIASNTFSITSSFFTFSEKLGNLVYLRWLFIALLPVLILIRYPVDRVDYDLWWHLAHGKYYLTHHTLTLDLSYFSWTPTDPTWIYNTCLGSIVVYLFYNFMGGFGLWLYQSLIFIGVFVSYYLFLRLIRQRLDITGVTLIAAIGIACSIACRFYKPELFSLLLFPWMFLIFYCVKITRKKFLFYLYPVMFALWVNLHGAFVVGLASLLLILIGEVLNRFFFPEESFTNEELAHFAAAFVLSMAATLINPYGIDYVLSTYNNVTADSSYVGKLNSKYILAYLGLWMYLKDTSLLFFNCGLTAWIMTLMIIAVFILSAYELIKKGSCDFASLIVSCALYWKGMETSRASYFFPVAFFFIFFYLLIHRLKMEKIPAKATIISMLFFIFFFVSLSVFTLRYCTDSKWFGAGLYNFVPKQEVAFLKKYHLEGQIFNDYVIGGYLVWDLFPDYKVFIDPRGGAYRQQVFPDYMDFTKKHVTIDDINQFNQKYPFKIVIFHYRQMALIFDFLRAGDEWRLLYFEKTAAILIHKSLLPAIQTEMGSVDLSPMRFKDVRNPEILLNVFNFYVHLNPKAGRYIYHVFKNNVSDYYALKPDVLRIMELNILNRERELQSKSQWLSP